MQKDFVVRISPEHAPVLSSQKRLQSAARYFQKRNFVRLRGFFPARLLHRAQKNMAAKNFYRKEHKDIATELCMRPNALFRLLNFITNDEGLFRLIEKITGCGPIGCFTGRVYRMNSGRHHDSWHDDWAQHRLIAMSVNLSEKVYRGGFLMLRSKSKPGAIRCIPNTGPGDAVLFRLGNDLEHQVANVIGTVPKTAYAGWFRSRPDYLKSIKELKKKKPPALF